MLGEWLNVWPELANVRAALSEGETEIASGLGSAALGHPFASVAWLADNLAKHGDRLRAGDIVMTGNLIKGQFPDRPTPTAMRLRGWDPSTAISPSHVLRRRQHALAEQIGPLFRRQLRTLLSVACRRRQILAAGAARIAGRSLIVCHHFSTAGKSDNAISIIRVARTHGQDAISRWNTPPQDRAPRVGDIRARASDAALPCRSDRSHTPGRPAHNG